MSKISTQEEKMLNLQYQMKQNNEDLKNFLTDLDNWETEMKQHEQVLSKTQSKSSEKSDSLTSKSLPPVRNSLNKKKLKKKVKKKTDPSKPLRINSYDYRSWDKFDVDKACENIDANKASSSEEYETDEEWELERKKQAAVMEKDKGNDFFKRGDYENAIECYTKGVDLDPTNPLLFANRAMALLKQEKLAAAELDCSIALTLDPLYTKAYLRRGTSRLGLKKYVEAKSDYEKVLQLEPQNKQAKSDIELIDKELAKEKLVAHTGSVATNMTGLVKAVFKAPHERSMKPLRHIDIEEVGLEDEHTRKPVIAPAATSQSKAKQHFMQQGDESFQRFTATSPGDIAMLVNNNKQNNIPNEYRNDAIDDHKMHADSPHTCDNVIKTNLETGTSPIKDPCDQRKAELRQTSSERIPIVTIPECVHGQGHTSQFMPCLSVPLTSIQFQADFRRLKADRESFYHYFKKISPSDYPKLFGEFLDADVLMTILRTINDFYIALSDDYYECLQSLTSVKRFSMVAMFLSKKEKEVLTNIFTHLQGSSRYPETDINSLKSKYDVR